MVPAKVGQILDRSNDSSHALVILCPALPSIGQLLTTGAQLVRAQASQVLRMFHAAIASGFADRAFAPLPLAEPLRVESTALAM
jgi:hypothetical protein